jgi:hypothetical protein
MMKTRTRINIRVLWISLPFFLFLLFLNPCPVLAEFNFEKIKDNGDDANRMVWIIMGDGYRSLEIDDYHQDVDRVINEFFSTSPWDDYKSFNNVYRIDVISNESGADHPSSNIYVDTALDGTYDTYGIGRLLTVDDSKAFEIASMIPSFDAVMIIVNDESYGGSGGSTMVLSNHEKAGRIALHEAGHLIGDLADEYETPYPGYPEGDSEPNVTYQTEFEYIPWKNWIDNITPLPTPEYEGYYDVGIYEGARYKSSDIYRPTSNSIMRSLGAPYGPINSEAIIINLHDFVDPIDKYSPVENNIFLSSSSNNFQFNIDLVPSINENIDVSWGIDGVIQEGEKSTALSIDASTLKKGSYSVKVSVADNTSLVRSDPQGLLLSSKIWSIEKQSASGVISGTVVNAINNMGIEGVLVEVEEGEYSTITKADGSFKLTPVTEGVYTIIANCEKYNSNVISGINVVDGETSTITFPLDPLFNTYSISGSIMGDLKEGVIINLKKGEDILLSSETNAEGSYFFNGLESGSYRLTPISNEYIFNPPFYELSVDNKDFTGVNFEALATFCPAQLILEGQSSSLNLLRKLRNKVLVKNKIGEKYTNLYYRHAPELVGLVIAHEAVREDSIAMISNVMPHIMALTQGKDVMLDQELIEEIEDFIDTLGLHASSDLKKTLNSLRKDMKNKNALYEFGVTIQYRERS